MAACGSAWQRYIINVTKSKRRSLPPWWQLFARTAAAARQRRRQPHGRSPTAPKSRSTAPAPCETPRSKEIPVRPTGLRVWIQETGNKAIARKNSRGREHGPSGSQSGTRVWSKKRAAKPEREQQRKGARTIRRRRSNCRQPGRSAALRSRRPPSPKPAAERNKAPGAAERKKRRVG